MKLYHALFLTMLGAAVLLRAADPAIEFSGVLTTGDKTRLALTDSSTKTTTWVEPGQNFKGYTVARYDAKEDAVYLRRGTQETRLALVSAKAPDASRSPATVATQAGANAADSTAVAIRANLRLLASAARQYQEQRGVTTASYADLVGAGKIIRELRPVAGEDYSTLSFGPNVTGVNVTTSSGMTVALDLPTGATAPSNVSIATRVSNSPTNPVATAGAAASPSTPSAIAGSTSTIPPVGSLTVPDATSPGSQALEPTGRPIASPTYMIQGGDTWQKVSERTGVPVQQLKQLNPSILDGAALPTGQAIRVR
jgi:LysM repeat protein